MATCQESALTTPSCQCYAKGFDGVSQIGSKIPPRLLCIDDFLAIKTCLYTRGVVVSTHLAEDRQTAMDSSVMRMDVHRSSCRNRHANAPPMPIANWSSRVPPRAQDFQHEIWPTYSSASHASDVETCTGLRAWTGTRYAMSACTSINVAAQSVLCLSCISWQHDQPVSHKATFASGSAFMPMGSQVGQYTTLPTFLARIRTLATWK